MMVQSNRDVSNQGVYNNNGLLIGAGLAGAGGLAWALLRRGKGAGKMMSHADAQTASSVVAPVEEGFKPMNFLKNAVESEKLVETRVGLSSYLSGNPANVDNKVSHAVQYSKDKFGDKLWMDHDNLGKSLEQDKSKWTKDYLANLKSDLRENFSEERFNHILDVGRQIRGKPQQL